MQWFKHLSTMSFDPKVKRVIRRYGVEGYGLYCYFLECIARNLDEARPVPDLEETAEDIAGDLKMDSRKVEEITAYMMQQGLFDFHDATNRIVAFKMIDYLDEYHRKKGGVSKIRKALQDIEVRQCPDKLLTSSGDSAQEENRIDKEVDKEKSKNKSRKDTPQKHKYGEYKHVLLTDDQRDRLISDWGQSVFDAMVKKLDEGIQMKGYKYTDHNLVLRKWRAKEPEDKNLPLPEVVF